MTSLLHPVEVHPPRVLDLRAHGSRTAIHGADGRLSYDELADRVDAVAARLGDTRRLVLVEGFWHTGSGLTAGQAEALLRGAGREPTTYPLTDEVLWGGPITDERYLVVA